MQHLTTVFFHVVTFADDNESVLVELIPGGLILPIYRAIPRSRVPYHVQQHLCRMNVETIVNGVLSGAWGTRPPEDVVLWGVSGADAKSSSPRLRWVSAENSVTNRMFLPFQRNLFNSRASWSACPSRSIRVQDIKEWVRCIAASSGRTITGSFSQLRAGGQRLLLRFAVEAGPPLFYFAGTAVPGEAELVTSLASRCPLVFPETLANDSGSSQWLTHAVPGEPLSSCMSHENCLLVGAELAKLQVRLIASSGLGTTATSGASRAFCDRYPERDFRLSTLASDIEPTFAQLQNSYWRHFTQPTLLTESLLAAIRNGIQEALSLDVPDSFVHFDATPPNIFLSDALHLIDFDAAGWGFPFLTLETLLQSEELSKQPAWRADVSRSYLRPWLDVLSERRVRRALDLMPLLRVWFRLKRLLRCTFELEPERYWHADLYLSLLSGFTRKLARLA